VVTDIVEVDDLVVVIGLLMMMEEKRLGAGLPLEGENDD
jgi:hypothetical protein